MGRARCCSPRSSTAIAQAAAARRRFWRRSAATRRSIPTSSSSTQARQRAAGFAARQLLFRGGADLCRRQHGAGLRHRRAGAVELSSQSLRRRRCSPLGCATTRRRCMSAPSPIRPGWRCGSATEMARIAVGGLHHETNTFAPQPATFERFAEADGWPELSRGAALIANTAGINLPVTGFVDAARAAGHELVPLVWANAVPSRPHHRGRLRADRRLADRRPARGAAGRCACSSTCTVPW